MDNVQILRRALEANSLTPEERAEAMAHMNKLPNPCCGLPGPCHMDAPDGPVCHCGKPSTEQSGLCGDCLGMLDELVR